MLSMVESESTQIISLVIPKEFAKDLGLDQPSHVIVEKLGDGLLIKKLNL